MPTITPRYALLYTLVPDYLERREGLRAAHLALVEAARERGEFVMGGAFADPADRALLIFATREAAESFAQADPYVQNGLVTAHEIRTWNTVSP